MKSLSEIETTVKRASKAAGFSWGESEEIGKCIRQLEMFGLPGIKHLNSYFHDKMKNNYENLSLINQSNSSPSSPYCPIILGIGFLDQLKTLENYQKIYFSSIAYPILFLSFLSLLSTSRLRMLALLHMLVAALLLLCCIFTASIHTCACAL